MRSSLTTNRSPPFARDIGGPWRQDTTVPGGVVALESIECKLDVDDIYRDPLRGA